ncbi:hypothetical protein [Kitasatospora mediocidica]|uniref:hypothetical protein n=1 Tax=Kitasatospora mediocidica TaxID=58352 RepID=UPI00055DFBCA|nr:hypothetical protein [Kitasatospora mediocidica]
MAEPTDARFELDVLLIGTHPVTRGRALDAYRDQVLTEAADHLDRIADATEAKVAEHYGPASGIGPGSADMVREAARTVRSLATAPDGR